MFKELGNLAYDRNWKQAIGFYCMYVLVTFVIFLLISLFVGIVISSTNTATGQEHLIKNIVGASIALFMGLIMSFLLTRAKRMKGFQVVLYMLGTLIFSFFGLFTAMLIPAFLTTRKTTLV